MKLKLLLFILFTSAAYSQLPNIPVSLKPLRDVSAGKGSADSLKKGYDSLAAHRSILDALTGGYDPTTLLADTGKQMRGTQSGRNGRQDIYGKLLIRNGDTSNTNIGTMIANYSSARLIISGDSNTAIAINSSAKTGEPDSVDQLAGTRLSEFGFFRSGKLKGGLGYDEKNLVLFRSIEGNIGGPILGVADLQLIGPTPYYNFGWSYPAAGRDSTEPRYIFQNSYYDTTVNNRGVFGIKALFGTKGPIFQAEYAGVPYYKLLRLDVSGGMNSFIDGYYYQSRGNGLANCVPVVDTTDAYFIHMNQDDAAINGEKNFLGQVKIAGSSGGYANVPFSIYDGNGQDAGLNIYHSSGSNYIIDAYNGGAITGTYSNTDWLFRTANTTRLTIQGNGNIKMGTVAYYADPPYGLLSVGAGGFINKLPIYYGSIEDSTGDSAHVKIAGIVCADYVQTSYNGAPGTTPTGAVIWENDILTVFGTSGKKVNYFIIR